MDNFDQLVQEIVQVLKAILCKEDVDQDILQVPWSWVDLLIL